MNAATFDTDLKRLTGNGLKFLNMGERELNGVAYQILEAVETLEEGTY